MTEYEKRGAREICQHLGYTPGQVLLIGQLLSLKENEDLVRFVRTDRLHNHLLGGPKDYILEFGKPREITMTIPLQPKWQEVSHEALEQKIRKTLDDIGVSKEADFFSYGTRSYGLEHENISAVIGCLHFRTDMLLNSEDKLRLEGLALA